MDGRAYFLAYIDQQGGAPAAASRLRIPYPTLAAIVNGGRGISKAMADRMVAADPMLDWARLVRVRATRKAA